MSSDRHPILRVVLALFFLGWGFVQCVMFARVLPAWSVVSTVYLLSGLLMILLAVLGWIRRPLALARLLCCVLFLITAAVFVITLILSLFTDTSAAWGNLLTAFLAALFLSVL